MGLIDTLLDEHGVIRGMADALEGWSDRLESGGEAAPEDLARFTEFFREYADARHHGKEEDVLFRVLEEQGEPLDSGPLSAFLHEHGESRGLAGTLAELAGSAGAWGDAERARAVKAARTYAMLLRSHIFHEDRVFEQARETLAGEVGRRADEESERFDRERDRVAPGSELESLARDLIGRYGPPPPVRRP